MSFNYTISEHLDSNYYESVNFFFAQFNTTKQDFFFYIRRIAPYQLQLMMLRTK